MTTTTATTMYPHTPLASRRSEVERHIPTMAEAQQIADDLLMMASERWVGIVGHILSVWPVYRDYVIQIALDLARVGLLSSSMNGYIAGPCIDLSLVGSDWYRAGHCIDSPKNMLGMYFAEWFAPELTQSDFYVEQQAANFAQRPANREVPNA